MPLIREFNKKISLLLILLVLSGCMTSKTGRIPEKENDDRTKIEKADLLLEKGQYRKAHKILTDLLADHPYSSYTDDAQYRLAYLHVVADDKNPYFNYRQARKHFMEFVSIFPKSKYVSPCNNWLKILNLALESEKKNASPRDGKNECKGLENKVKALSEENKKLREIIRDFESVLER
ncbi:MAG: hypothetical protein JXR46_08280 [Calditrichaceae bacterium]|nr:hypothetical protein [Calditrichaceae bacterium]MBN2709027.1 hypothetical protein [Calditrichaceae bacterium]RQV95321.1 MAG: hypothetical protein EH224_07855 [Calditrichota bacterium]